MKIITQTFIVFIALLVLPLSLFAQAKSVTSEDYYATRREAQAKTEKQIRRTTQTYKSYTNGKITETHIDTSEKLPPDKSRWIHTEEMEGRVVKKIEQITIGNSVYRKEDNGAWVKREKGDFGLGISGTDDSTREFFIEQTTIGKEKFQVLVMKTVNFNKTFFDEDKKWINEKGLITKSTLTTSENELKNIVSTVEVTYDYKIKPPKIEPPIK